MLLQNFFLLRIEERQQKNTFFTLKIEERQFDVLQDLQKIREQCSWRKFFRLRLLAKLIVNTGSTHTGAAKLWVLNFCFKINKFDFDDLDFLLGNVYKNKGRHFENNKKNICGS